MFIWTASVVCSAAVLLAHWSTPHQPNAVMVEAFALGACAALILGVMWHSRRDVLKRERWELWRAEQINRRQDSDGL